MVHLLSIKSAYQTTDHPRLFTSLESRQITQLLHSKRNGTNLPQFFAKCVAFLVSVDAEDLLLVFLPRTFDASFVRVQISIIIVNNMSKISILFNAARKHRVVLATKN